MGCGEMRKIATLTALLLLLSAPAATIDLLHPNVRFINNFPMPASMTPPLGDIAFSADGNTAWFIDAAGTVDATVWSTTVERAKGGTVTGFSSVTAVFSAQDADGGLTVGPGTDTFVYRTAGLGITQRFADGSFEHYEITDYDNSGGGLAFVPEAFSSAGNIVTSSCSDNRMYRHSVSDDGDGSFSIGAPGLYENLESLAFLGLCLGDVEFVSEGALSPTLVFVVFGPGGSLGDLWALELDASSGEPVDGTMTEPFPLAGSIDNGQNWGLAVDPISGHVFVVDRESSNPEIFQFSLDGVFLDRFEASP